MLKFQIEERNVLGFWREPKHKRDERINKIYSDERGEDKSQRSGLPVK